MLQLLSNKRVQSFRRIREEETSLMIEKIKRSSPGVVNLSKVFIDLTNDVVCRAVLGRTYGGKDGERDFNQILGKFIEMLRKFDVGDFVPWLGWINRVNGVKHKLKMFLKCKMNFWRVCFENIG